LISKTRKRRWCDLGTLSSVAALDAGEKWDQEKFRACFKTLVSLYAFIMAVVNAALFAVVSALG
jgi:hypothetical protein